MVDRAPHAPGPLADRMTLAVELVDAIVVRGATRAVDRATLTISEGCWTGLMGANGSGKTSLLRALAGRLPFAGGQCRIMGADLADDRAARAHAIGFAPPIETLPQALSVREALRSAALGECVGLGELGEALDLGSLLDRAIGDCSSGMRQRVAIACAFARPTPIVVLDEPFNWLDPVAAFDAKQALQQRVDDGLTLITALHDIATLTSVCDAGAIMRGGKIALELDDAALRTSAKDLPAFERTMIGTLRAAAQG